MIKLSGFQKLLALFIIFISGMIVCRVLYSGSIRFIFLFWNLFLAWIPYRISRNLQRSEMMEKWKAWFFAAAWLVFFPNALYIITDLIHLEEKSNVPVWYDAVLLFIAAVAGLLMAFASLFSVESFFIRQIGTAAGGRLIFLCLFLGSFGVYLGRFLRWNSWDVVTDPLNLAREIAVRFFYPVEYYHTWAITLLFTCLYSLLYFTIKKFTVNESAL